ncbi:adenylosuccinate synthetase [Clavibacter michiganensis]|uniref:adenylosuccinate synthetase n=1 Tax=Clavibacter michiganensis TaxID=28447 RepID=UPI003DA036E3
MSNISAFSDDIRVITLSGPVGAGKSTLAIALADELDGVRISTRQMLMDIAVAEGFSLEPERRALQDFGVMLDTRTSETWVSDGVLSAKTSRAESVRYLIVDAIRTEGQLESLRSRFGAQITHINLTAPSETLSARYEARLESGIRELNSYSAVASNAVEANVSHLSAQADVVIDTSRSSSVDVLTRALSSLGFDSSRQSKLVDIFVGGQYGSEGKGNIAFHVAREYNVLMRVGGPNAGHTVPTDPPYTHRSLPSGTLANPDARLLIGPGATIRLDVLLKEIEECSVEAHRLSIDPNVMIIEEADIQAEVSLTAAIGSTGKGGGAAAARRITGRNTGAVPVRLAKEVKEIAAYVRDTGQELEKAFRRGERVMLEGTQGTMLSLFHGFYPWVTSRDTTAAACLAEAGIGIQRVRRVVMVVRTYPIRVGNPPDTTSGIMSQEIDWDIIATRSGLDERVLREREKGSVSGSKRRVAEFDWAVLKRAAELNGATDIALTFVDYLDAGNEGARRFDQLTDETIQFIEEVGKVAGSPVTLVATSFDARPLIDRRKW